MFLAEVMKSATDVEGNVKLNDLLTQQTYDLTIAHHSDVAKKIG